MRIRTVFLACCCAVAVPGTVASTWLSVSGWRSWLRPEPGAYVDEAPTEILEQNNALSQRRAEVVASELVARGISREEIGVTAFGESRPLVATADGVREPQNRRVEIVLR